MGAVGAIVLAMIRHPRLGSFGRKVFVVSIIACLAGILAYQFNPKGLPFQLCFGLMYLGIAYMCVRAAQMADLRSLLVQAYQSTARLTAMVAFILVGSTCFSVVFQGVDGGRWIEHMLTSLPGGSWGFLLVVNLFVFFLAFFLDFFEIAFIIVPMLAPVAQKMLAPIVGDSAALIWFGVILCVNMQTSFMHPPFGFALFYLRGVAPKEVKSSDIYWGAIPWVLLQLCMVAIVIAFPFSVTAFLDKEQKIDLDKVKIEIPQDADTSGRSAADEQKAQDDATNDIQKALGGGDVKDAPKDGAAKPADKAADKSPDKSAEKSADERAQDAIEKAIREGNK